MALKTTLEKLEEIEARIEKAQRAQSLGKGSFSRQSANLDTLYKERDRLQAKYDREQGRSASRTYAKNKRRFSA